MTVANDVKPSFSLLDGEYYTSEEVFAKEYERIFSREWIYAAHISQFPQKGSFVKISYGGEEIVVVRGAGDDFYANLNVCRHRGFRLCDDDAGRVRAFVCPYHQWSFALDGTLSRVPQMADGEYFDFADFPLRTAHAELWNGLVFVNLNPEPVQSIGESLSGFDEMIARFAPADTKLAHEQKYVLEANWKVAVENAMECYHCPGTHRTLCSVIDVAGLQADLKEWLADADGDGPSDLGASGMRLAEGKKSLTADGELLTDKLLGTLTETDYGISGGVMVVPNFFYAAFYVDHWWFIAVRPVSATRTEFFYTWFVRSDAEEGVDFNRERMIEVGHTTQSEDNVLIERTQRGISSRYFTPGPLSTELEAGLHDFVTNYEKYMA